METSPRDWPIAPTGMRKIESSLAMDRAPREKPIWLIVAIIGLFLLPISLIPSSRGFFFNFPFLPSVWWKTNLILVLCFFAVLLRPFVGYSAEYYKPTRRWFLVPLLILAAWEVLSLTWTNREGYMKSYSFYQAILMGATILGAYSLASGLPFQSRVRLGQWVTAMLMLIFFIYFGLSFIFPSWRPSFSTIDRTEMSLGFIRLFGPLGKSTTLLFILLPVLGFCIGMVFVPGKIKLAWIGAAAFVFTCTFATGSRGSLLCLGTFGFCILLSLRLRAALLFVPLVFVFGTVLLFTGIPERFKHFEDNSRLATYQTALRAFGDRPQHMLIGTGHGELYSALHDVTERKLLRRDRWYLLTEQSAYGFTLRSSHTAILRSLAETGIVGFLLQVIPLLWLVKRLVWPSGTAKSSPYKIFSNCVLAGTIAPIPYMFFDEFFVSAFWIVLLWSLFVIIGTECQADADGGRINVRKLRESDDASHGGVALA